MNHDLKLASRQDFSTQYSSLVEDLYDRADGRRWGLPRQAFAEGLNRSVEKRFGNGQASASEIETYLKSLHLEDLALACACSEGLDAAWEFFVEHFRQDLRGASRAILPSSGPGNDARAEELADSIYAELYGVRSPTGERRKSLFEYFHGRSKLSTWLRAVLAQRHVDFLRSSRVTVSLDDKPAESEEHAALEIAQRADETPIDPDRTMYLARIDRALAEALAALKPRDRMLLACYYVDQQTLAEIGKMFREHESTVSRQLQQTRTRLRETVTSILRRETAGRDERVAEPGLDEAQVELAFEYAVEDWSFDLSRALSTAENRDPADP